MLEPLPEPVSVRVAARRFRNRLLVAIASRHRHRFWSPVGIAAGLAGVTVAIRVAGGTGSGFPNFYYFVILAGGYFYGVLGGMATALAAAGAAAALPVSAAVQTQPTGTTAVRFGVFVFVGAAVGLLVTAFSRQASYHAQLVDQAARGLWRALDTQDRETAEHAERVSVYAPEIAREMRLPADQVERVRVAGLIHNIGRIAVAHGSTVEPMATESILHEIHDLEPLVAVVRSHREHWNGSGAPDGLHSHQIPLEARIIGVANAYDNLTVPHEGFEPLTPVTALGLIRAEAGKRFDPAVVSALESLFVRWRVVLAPDFFVTHERGDKTGIGTRRY